MNLPVYSVVVAESFPDLSLWVAIDNILIPDFATNASFVLEVFNPDDNTVTLFTKTAGFIGQIGLGTENDVQGAPNLIVQWATSGELDQLTAGRSHPACLTVTRLSDGKTALWPFVLRATAKTG